MDNRDTVHQINVLTVVASQSYKDFVTALQKDMSDSLSGRPRVADAAYFIGKVLKTPTGDVDVTEHMANQIYRYLIKNDYADDDNRISKIYFEAKKSGSLADFPADLATYSEQIVQLIDSIFSEEQLPDFTDDRKGIINLTNANFEKKEFKALWNRINKKAVYTVQFDSDELLEKCITTLNKELKVTPMQYIIHRGEQIDSLTYDDLKKGDGFSVNEIDTKDYTRPTGSTVKYDLIGKLTEETQLTRATVAKILQGIDLTVFKQYKTNPEDFIAKSIRLINEQKATVIVEHLAYDTLTESYDLDIFTQDKSKHCQSASKIDPLSACKSDPPQPFYLISNCSINF